jgi:hypothetical protein
MGAKERKQITDAIRAIGKADVYEIYSGDVHSVNETELTIAVKLNEDVIISGVQLKATIAGDQGFYVVPKNGSHVKIARLDGGVNYSLLQASDIDKLVFKIGNATFVADENQIVMNGGHHHGMVKVSELTQKLNALENKVNELIGLCKSMTVALAPSGTYPLGTNFFASVQNLQTTSQNDIENPNVKH